MEKLRLLRTQRHTPPSAARSPGQSTFFTYRENRSGNRIRGQEHSPRLENEIDFASVGRDAVDTATTLEAFAMGLSVLSPPLRRSGFICISSKHAYREVRRDRSGAELENCRGFKH